MTTPSPAPIVLRGGPNDGLTLTLLTAQFEIGVWDHRWLADRSMKIPTLGFYRSVPEEWSVIGGKRHTHYVWEGWLW